jgi:transposase InsO family protein
MYGLRIPLPKRGKDALQLHNHDSYDCSVLAIVNGHHITAELVIRCLQIAIARYKPRKGLISTLFKEASLLRDSPKQELINLFMSKTEIELDVAVVEFRYGWYNRVRPHTYNGGLTPAAARVP